MVRRAMLFYFCTDHPSGYYALDRCIKLTDPISISEPLLLHPKHSQWNESDTRIQMRNVMEVPRIEN